MARKKKTENVEEVEKMESTVEEFVDEVKANEDVKQLEIERVKDCTMAIKGVLAQYNCALDASVTLRQNQVIPDIRVVPLNPVQ